jgi:hypothetical protein
MGGGAVFLECRVDDACAGADSVLYQKFDGGRLGVEDLAIVDIENRPGVRSADEALADIITDGFTRLARSRERPVDNPAYIRTEIIEPGTAEDTPTAVRGTWSPRDW